MNHQSVLTFWREAGPKAWFSKSDEFDASIREKFGQLHSQAISGELEDWRENAESALSLVVLIDQFSRNLNRNSALAFANDAYCLKIAKGAIEKQFDRQDSISDISNFFYLPLMHSENIDDQRACLKLMEDSQNAAGIKAAQEHLDIIDRFGRFPHRNKVLNRNTTPQEQAFLDEGGFKG